MTPGCLPFELLEGRRYFAFGLTQSGNNLIVDNGAAIVFTINRTNAEMTSLRYKGQELLAPFSVTSRYSHLQSGLGSVTTTTAVTANTVVISCTAGTLTHYYIVRRNYNDVVFGTYASEVPAIGELRWITYLDRSKFTPNPLSDIFGKPAIEGSDVFGDSAGRTTSKYYSGQPFIDQPYYGVTGVLGGGSGGGVGVWMMTPNRETSSGGPFFQDISEQGSAAVELYNYIFSGHTQTEPFRPGLSLYALEINDGAPPVPVDFSFVAGLNLLGYVPASGRGSLSGTVSGGFDGEPITVGLKNAAAQYFARAIGGGYSIAGIKPGTYTLTMYSDQYEVLTRTVTIAAGQHTALNLRATASLPAVAWRIGRLDGTPQGFLNADKIPLMHPSDVRMADWGPVTFTIGETPESAFPALQWKTGVNQPTTIRFTLDKVTNSPHTLRIALSISQYGARPVVAVNPQASYRWSSSVPPIPNQPNSRGVTRGTTRGNNVMFTYSIPASALRAGLNTIQIDVASGSSGTTFLSPGWAYDMVDFAVPTVASVKPGPDVTGIGTSIGTGRDTPAPVPPEPPFTPLTPLALRTDPSLFGQRPIPLF